MIISEPANDPARGAAYQRPRERLFVQTGWFLYNHAKTGVLVQSYGAMEQNGLNDRTPKPTAGASGSDYGPLNAPAPTLNNKLRMPHRGAHPSAAWPSRQVSFLAPGRAEHNVASKEDL